MKFTGILFDVFEGLLTAKIVYCNDLIMFIPENKYMFKVIIRNTRKSVKYIQI